MHLRAIIEGNGRHTADRGFQISTVPDSHPRTPATLATLATLPAERKETGRSVATVATVAAIGEPESWPDRLRSLPPVEGVSWDLAAAVLDSLMRAGTIDKALGLGWDVREIIGVCRAAPHDSPSLAGLIWSVKPGDTVPDVRRAGCIIAYANVRHIWKRTPIAAAICLPWELAK
jgi:hypothetical protein